MKEYYVTENKILNPISMLGQNNTRSTLDLGVSKYPQLLPKVWYGLMDLNWLLLKVWQLYVDLTYVIGHNFINPTYECGVK